MGRHARRQTCADRDLLHVAIDPEGAQRNLPRALAGVCQSAAQRIQQLIQRMVDGGPGHDRFQEVDRLDEDRRLSDGRKRAGAVPCQPIEHIHQRTSEASRQRATGLAQEFADPLQAETVETNETLIGQPQHAERQRRYGGSLISGGNDPRMMPGARERSSGLRNPGDDNLSGDAAVLEGIADAGQ
jgi:hypothetical protein